MILVSVSMPAINIVRAHGRKTSFRILRISLNVIRKIAIISIRTCGSVRSFNAITMSPIIINVITTVLVVINGRTGVVVVAIVIVVIIIFVLATVLSVT